MIAEERCRRKGLAKEAVLMLMRYGKRGASFFPRPSCPPREYAFWALCLKHIPDDGRRPCINQFVVHADSAS